MLFHVICMTFITDKLSMTPHETPMPACFDLFSPIFLLKPLANKTIQTHTIDGNQSGSCEVIL